MGHWEFSIKIALGTRKTKSTPRFLQLHRLHRLQGLHRLHRLHGWKMIDADWVSTFPSCCHVQCAFNLQVIARYWMKLVCCLKKICFFLLNMFCYRFIQIHERSSAIENWGHCTTLPMHITQSFATMQTETRLTVQSPSIWQNKICKYVGQLAPNQTKQNDNEIKMCHAEKLYEQPLHMTNSVYCA